MTDPERGAGGGTLAEIERSLEQARRIMAPGHLGGHSEGWLLLASLVGETDLALREMRRRDPSLAFPLLEAVVAELYEMTSGFTDPDFLRNSRPARRRNPALFRAGL